MLTRLYHQLRHHFRLRTLKSVTPDLQAAFLAEVEQDYATALRELEITYAAFPDDRDCQLAFGRVLAKSGQLTRSIGMLRSTATRWPNDSEIHLTLANALFLDGDANEAITHFRAALVTNPSYVPALVGLGNALRETGLFEEAYRHLTKAVDIAPHIPEIFDNMGQLLQDMGQLKESMENFKTALLINPSFANAQLHLGISQLLDGDFEQGWYGYEARLIATHPPADYKNYLRWSGQHIPYGTLLLLTEQGLGDEIMFASCFPDVISRVKNIVVECSPKLCELYQRSFPTISVIKKNGVALIDRKQTETEYAMHIGSLGSIFRKTKSDFPSHAGYLIADPDKRRRWREKLLALGPGLKVGIAWSGGTRLTRTKLRSVPLLQWDAILKTQSVHFISLQHTECAHEIAAVTTCTGVSIQHWQAAIDDYDETAALVCELDLIISVQTAVVHLAGALGKPVWAIIPVCPEWRYLREGVNLPWYPSVRLFRQHQRAEWQDVLANVQLNLTKLVARDQEKNPITLICNDTVLSSNPTVSTSNLTASPPKVDSGLYKEAISLVKRGDLSNALELLRQSAVISPRDLKISRAIANILHLNGDFSEAIDCYRRIILAAPDDTISYSNLGNSLRELGQYNEAAKHLQKALSLTPSCAEAAHNLGLCHLALDEIYDAIANFKRAISMSPFFAAPLRALFEVYRKSGDVNAAINLLQGHISQYGECAEAIFLLGLGYYWTGDLAQGERYFRRAIAIDPSHSEAWDNLGVTIQDAGKPGDAIAYYSKSIEINSKSNAPRWHRALARLALGDFQHGWEDYEFRPGISESLARVGLPRWNGEANPNIRLLVLPEQGLGDEIMFSSCVPDAAKTVAQTVLVCSSKLERLFARSFPNAIVTTEYSASTAAHGASTASISIGSLPLYFRRKTEDFALLTPYLAADPSSVQGWRHKLNTLGPGLKVGISWQGGTTFTRRAMRSLPLSAWLPVLRCEGAHFVSLQYTPIGQELSNFASRYGIEITHWQEAIDDYDQTAALISALDLVVSIQTAVVHLSGALGKPTWVLVPARPEWRYGLYQNSLPWYSNVIVFRQQTPNEWSSVIADVAHLLNARSNA